MGTALATSNLAWVEGPQLIDILQCKQVHVPLSPSISDTRQTGNFADDDEALPSDLLPMPHLTATTVLGGTVPERDTVAQLLATQIGSAIAMRDPQESRMLVVGTGLQQAELSRDEFMSLVDLALEAL